MVGFDENSTLFNRGVEVLLGHLLFGTKLQVLFHLLQGPDSKIVPELITFADLLSDHMF